MKAVIVVKMGNGYLVIPSKDPFISSDLIPYGSVVEKSYNMSGLGTTIESIFNEAEDRSKIPPQPVSVREAKDDLPL